MYNFTNTNNPNIISCVYIKINYIIAKDFKVIEKKYTRLATNLKIKVLAKYYNLLEVFLKEALNMLLLSYLGLDFKIKISKGTNAISIRVS